MSNPFYVKSVPGKWASEGIRVASEESYKSIGYNEQTKIIKIIEAMEWPKLIVFRYDDSDRVVAPFVVGVSSEGVPLMRGYQLEGISRSGKGAGWRVFKVSKMENVEDYQEFFDASDFDFNRFYPWVWEVYKML